MGDLQKMYMSAISKIKESAVRCMFLFCLSKASWLASKHKHGTADELLWQQESEHVLSAG